ncbi:hypothetical protein AVEN_165736-1 [Araneus ventricosus]|uniref:Secreted protein n=1 Tax=Araneus ventricosus TaxID=182803 RepID=A0A4Y2C441_ARAVE|nr:hypothetical protein AVEN_165736-1 [Araneus ventricosus]
MVMVLIPLGLVYLHMSMSRGKCGVWCRSRRPQSTDISPEVEVSPSSNTWGNHKGSTLPRHAESLNNRRHDSSQE